MSGQIAHDKSGWGDGPWQTEPDEVSWSYGDVPCRVTRNRLGVWCGYVGLPPGHPWRDADEESLDVDVHGGITWCGPFGDGNYAANTPLDVQVWWVGFDCAHGWDYMPAFAMRERALFGEASVSGGTYRDLAYATAEVESLARQAIAAMRGAR